LLLCELIGFLRRCLTQQSQIRENLYSGLYDIFATNSSLHDVIFELLLPQLMNYHDPNPEHTPIKLKECVEVSPIRQIEITNIQEKPGVEVQIREPLHQLLLCLCRCLVVHFHPMKAQKSLSSQTNKSSMSKEMTNLFG
jgi:hypothetical protein